MSVGILTLSLTFYTNFTCYLSKTNTKHTNKAAYAKVTSPFY